MYFKRWQVTMMKNIRNGNIRIQGVEKEVAIEAEREVVIGREKRSEDLDRGRKEEGGSLVYFKVSVDKPFKVDLFSSDEIFSS